VVSEHVVPVTLNSDPVLRLSVSAVIWRDPVPMLVMVTVLVTGVRAAGTENVRVRPPRTVVRVPFVAAVKAKFPGVTPVPVSETGVPVPVAPANETVSVLLNAVPFVVPVAGLNTML
jgi:hypothetical protein